ncbi:MAG: ribosome maturation factor RimM [Mariprofundaceae bacterium]
MQPTRKPRKRLTPEHLIEVGVVQAVHGLKGALTIYSHTRPTIGIAGYSFWWLGDSVERARRYEVIRCWQHGKRILARLEGVPDCVAAAALKGAKVWVPAADVEVSEDEYLWQDLIGCVVRDVASDLMLGTVTALEEFGAQDILTVRTADDADQPGEWLLPFVDDVVIDVDMDGNCITVRLPEGMDACFTPRS